MTMTVVSSQRQNSLGRKALTATTGATAFNLAAPGGQRWPAAYSQSPHSSTRAPTGSRAWPYERPRVVLQNSAVVIGQAYSSLE